jgi:hypothetical protein
MATMIINNKPVRMNKFQKARLLNVSQIEGEPGYVVSSGTEPHKSYRVSADCTECNCDAHVPCSHLIAAYTYWMESHTRAPRCIYCAMNHYAAICPFVN